MKAVQLLIPFICIFIFNRLYYHFLEGSSIWSQKSIDDSKSGFWFIFSLFCFLLTTKFCTILIKNINSITAKILVLISPFFIVTILCSILPYEIAGKQSKIGS